MRERFVAIRITVLLLALVGVFSVISWRLVYLQLTRHDHYSSEVASKHVNRETLPARRGGLTDRNGELLAADKPVRDVVVDLTHLTHLPYAQRAITLFEGITETEVVERYSAEEQLRRYLDYVAQVLSEPLGLEKDEIMKRLTVSSRGRTRPRMNGEVVLARGLEEEVGELLAQHLDSMLVRGVECRKEMSRHYATARLGHVIGFVNHQRAGVEGVEGSLDSLLVGKDGYREVSRDRRGDEILAFRGDVVEPRHGRSARLTVDMRIQEITEQALDAVYAEMNPEKAMAVVLRPRTGEILALANRPDFDRQAMKGNFRNFSVEAIYEPGSTFKIVPIGGVLDRGLVSLNTRIYCHDGYYKEPGLPAPLRDHHPYGELTVATIISKSSNIGTYKLSSQLGKEGLCEYIKAFGFGRKTNIELTGEIAGIVRPARRWSATSLSRVGMGYEVGVTPLQMVMAMGAVANGGKLLRPRIISALHDAGGREVSVFRPEVVSEPISPRASELLMRALAQATEEGGTGSKARVEGWSVAGKTGTSQRYDAALGRYVPGSYVTSFVGYAPREHPELAVVVVVDDPKNEKRFGGAVAAPVFAEIVGPSLEYLAIRGEIGGGEQMASSFHGASTAGETPERAVR